MSDSLVLSKWMGVKDERFSFSPTRIDYMWRRNFLDEVIVLKARSPR